MNNSPSKHRRRKGEGNGFIYWRTITINGKEYPQAYYHWQENGQKRRRYIPKKLLGDIQEANAAKRPIVEILQMLGVAVSLSKLLGDKQISPSNEGLEINPSNDISPSKMRRDINEKIGSMEKRQNPCY